MGDLRYVVGDATEPGKGRLIAHVTNTDGVWGAGFVVPLGQRYPEVKEAYLTLRRYPLGFNQYVRTHSLETTWVANMHAMSLRNGPDRFKLSNCVEEALTFAYAHDLNVVMPRIAAGIGGMQWADVEHIILLCMEWVAEDVLGKPCSHTDYPQQVYVVDLPSEAEAGKWPGTEYWTPESVAA